MKKMFALMLAPVVLLLVLLSAEDDQATSPTQEATTVHFASLKTDKQVATKNRNKAAIPSGADAVERDWIRAVGDASAGELITYAMSLMGTPYKYGGTTDSGFDCSGFTSHVFQEFGVPVSRSSTTQSEDGIAVSRDESQPGDLVIFTGTNPQVREPGHVGIVISEPGDTISFVHSSSNGGVKISQVEGTGYDVRFLGVRRVL